MHKISKEKHQSSSSNQYIKDFSAPCSVSFQMPPLALIATYFTDTLLVRASGANRNMRLRSLVAFYCILSDTKKELQLWLRLNCRKRRNVLGFSFPHLSAILLFLPLVWFSFGFIVGYSYKEKDVILLYLKKKRKGAGG